MPLCLLLHGIRAAILLVQSLNVILNYPLETPEGGLVKLRLLI
jgi:hypothetical protein